MRKPSTDASAGAQREAQGRDRMSSYNTQEQQDHRSPDPHPEASPLGNPFQKPRSPWRAIGVTLKNLSWLATGSGIALVFLLSVGGWQSTTRFLNGLHALLTGEQPEAKVDVRSMVVQQVRSASELTTAIFAMESVVPTSRERTMGGYVIGKTTLLYIAYGQVRAGVDLSSLRPEDVQVSGNTVSLRLPPPKILDSKIDVNRSQVYDYDRGFLGLGPDVAPELQQLAQRETLTKIVQAACSEGVLQTANDRAKLAVTQLLLTSGYTQFSVETQPPTANTCTTSASPAPTGGILQPQPIQPQPVAPPAPQSPPSLPPSPPEQPTI